MKRPTSTLGYALLGLLAREPLTGYELSRTMKAPVGFFWHARHSQIYPELSRLETQGLVAHQVVEQRERPDKKVYTISEAGRTALRQWVSEPTPEPPVRSELVLKVYSLWLADPEHSAVMFREQQQSHEEQLAQYEQFRLQMERDGGAQLRRVDSSLFATYATLRRGIGYERESADWCRWVAEQLEGGTDTAPV